MAILESTEGGNNAAVDDEVLTHTSSSNYTLLTA